MKDQKNPKQNERASLLIITRMQTHTATGYCLRPETRPVTLLEECSHRKIICSKYIFSRKPGILGHPARLQKFHLCPDHYQPHYQKHWAQSSHQTVLSLLPQKEISDYRLKRAPLFCTGTHNTES